MKNIQQIILTLVWLLPTLSFAYDFEADGCRKTYAQAEGWKEFKNIVEDAAQGQQTQPSFIKGNPVWVFKSECLTGLRTPRCWVDTNDRSFYYYFMGKEKEIEGRAYTMMGEVRMKDGELKVTKWLPVREEGGVVYTLTDSVPGVAHGAYKVGGDLYANIPYTRYGNECVLYDFNLQVGDQAANGYTVSSVDTCQLHDGSDCKVTVISNHFRLYDAIGYTNSLSGEIMDPWHDYPVFVSNNNIYGTRLNAYYRDGKMLYKAQELEDGWCVNDTCWDYNDAYNYATSYREDPNLEKVMQFINSSPEPDEELNDPTDAQDQQTQSIESAYIDMAMRTMSLMEQSEGEDGNKVFSPLSLEMALGMLQSGATDDTLEEIHRSMGVEGYTKQEVDAYNKKILDELKQAGHDAAKEDEKNVIRMANALFLEPSFSVKPEYVLSCQDFYNALVDNAKLTTMEDCKKIDEWCAEQTNGIIPSLELRPTPDRAMLLLNLLVFNARWQEDFPEYMPETTFFNNGTTPVIINTMRNMMLCGYAEADGFQVVKLDYNQDHRFSMYVYLSKDTLGTKPLTTEIWNTSHQEMEEYQTQLFLPPFNANISADMKDICKQLGMKKIFMEKDADLGDIALNTSAFHVQDIFQTSGIKTDIRGTMVYNATAVYADIPTGDLSEKKVAVRVNHPFYFTIEDNHSQSILYMGKINNITDAQQPLKIGIPTMISHPQIIGGSNDNLYDLQGRKVEAPRKGLYIKDSKKVIKR